MKINRRDFLRYSRAAGFVLTAGGLSALISGCIAPSKRAEEAKVVQEAKAALLNYASLDPTNQNNFNNPLNLPGSSGVLGILEAPATPIDIVVKQETLEAVRDVKTRFSVYQVNYAGKIYINPIFKIKKGDHFSATLINNLDEETIVHWHGLHVDWRVDGHPSYAISGGGRYSYNFAVQNRGGTYWYHPHPHRITGKQAYFGLSSFFIIEDDDENRLSRALDLKFGETDIPLVIQDKKFDSNGNIVYQPTTGFLGDLILVNLTINPYLEVGTRIYRFRLLNGSNSKTYKLAFMKGNDEVPYYVIATDGGLLDKPHQTTEAFISPAERMDVLLDLGKLELGDAVFLKSLAFDRAERKEADDNVSSATLKLGQEFYIMKLIVKNRVNYDKAMPQTLSSVVPIDASKADVRPFTLSALFINGKSFKMDEYPVTVNKSTTEIWEMTNESTSMHPMHIHGFQFQVLGRINSPEQVKNLAVYGSGRLVTDLGWKDVVLVWPGETVRIAINFSHNFAGEQIYLYHCHNLEHEDNGMMINYKVV